jgi:hypothetical protein
MRYAAAAGGAFAIGATLAWPRLAEVPREEADPAEFSASRALVQLAPLVERPRVSGTGAHREAVAAMQARLRALGFAAETREYGGLRNVEASADGDRAGGVWLVAHSDTVAGSPGGADDGLGLAVLLEAARVLSLGGVPPALHLLVTDGEEAGLLGARAFLADAPGAARLVLNVEARGSRGPAFMFQTAGPTGPLLGAWREAGCTAQAGSLARFVYDLLPNDTDFTVFRASGAHGYDFALIHGAWRYHTAEDTLAGLDPRAVQQVGDCVVGLARAWLSGPRDEDPGALAWQQVGPWMLAMPSSWVRIGGVVAALLVLHAARGQRLGPGLAAWAGALLLTGMGGVVALATLVWAWPDFLARPAEVERPEWLYALAWVLAAASTAAPARLARRILRWREAPLVPGWLAGGAVLAATASIIAPEAALVLLPGAFAAAAGLHGAGPRAGAARVAAAGLAGALLGPVLLSLPAALTSRALPVLAVAPILLVPFLLSFLLPGLRARQETP